MTSYHFMNIPLVQASNEKYNSCLKDIKKSEYLFTKILSNYAIELLAVHGCPLPKHENSYKIYMNNVINASSLKNLEASLNYMIDNYNYEDSCNANQMKGSAFSLALSNEIERFSNKTQECDNLITKEQLIETIDLKYSAILDIHHIYEVLGVETSYMS